MGRDDAGRPPGSGGGSQGEDEQSLDLTVPSRSSSEGIEVGDYPGWMPTAPLPAYRPGAGEAPSQGAAGASPSARRVVIPGPALKSGKVGSSEAPDERPPRLDVSELEAVPTKVSPHPLRQPPGTADSAVRDQAPPETPRSLLSFSWITDRSAWQVGAIVAGRYRLLDMIGTGGMGDVLLAEDLLLCRKVAMKTLRRNLVEDPRALDRFRQEVAMAHAVSHDGLARTFDMGEANGVIFLTMEYLPGETLTSRIKREGPLPLADVRRIGLQVADALAAAHRAGVIHRDLKPSNIQLTPERGAVVMDFGLAAAIWDRPRVSGANDGRSELVRPTSKSSGTPNYMAPEQWRGEPQGVATDIYSFGCILFEALTGRIPFQAENRPAMMKAHLEERPPSVRALRPGVPLALDRLVQACLGKDPAQRPASMLEIIGKLTEGRVQRVLTTAVLALGVLFLLVGGGAVIWETGSALLLREMRPAVKRLAMLAARDIDTALLDQVHGKQDIGSEGFEQVQQVLLRMRKDNPEVRYIYTMRKLPREGMWEFVVDADPVDEDQNGDGVISASEKGSPPGMRYDASRFPWMHLTYLEKTPQADDRFNTDAWGLLLSGYAPVKGPSDDFYLVGVDVTNQPLVRLRNTIYVVFLVLGLASATLVVLLRRRRALPPASHAVESSEK